MARLLLLSVVADVHSFCSGVERQKPMNFHLIYLVLLRQVMMTGVVVVLHHSRYGTAVVGEGFRGTEGLIHLKNV